MNPLDWVYFREGGKHALFRYQADEDGRWKGKLLRLTKQDLLASTLGFEDQIEDEYTETKSESDASPSTSYIRRIVMPVLEPYVDLPVDVCLPWKFLRSIYHETLLTASIPEHRLPDWFQKADYIPRRKKARGLLVDDYRIYPGIGQGMSLSVVIKPKAGYKAFSPLVHPNRRHKFVHTRFALLQQLNSRQSSYNPLDLFSQDVQRIQKALSCMLQSPQNNLEVWIDEDVIVNKDGIITMNENVSAKLVGMFGGKSKPSLDSFVNDAIKSLAQVLYHRDLLHKLQTLQRLDILDADGAIILYNRVVYMCKGSFEEADCLIEQVTPRGEQGSVHPLLQSSPVGMSHVSEETVVCLREYCNMVQEFEESLQIDHLDEIHLNASRQDAIAWIERAPLDVCVYLLQNWLFSLLICDVSLFVTFYLDKNWDLSTYRIKLIDCDPKPASKLRGRETKEQMLDDITINR